MTDSESTNDERSLEQKAFDDLDDIALMAQNAIAADVRGDASERTDLIHQINELAKSWSDVDPEADNE